MLDLLNPHSEESDLKLIIDELLKKNDLPENVKVNVKMWKLKLRKLWLTLTFLNRIMYNLVTNAVQAMPKGGKLTIHALQRYENDDPNNRQGYRCRYTRKSKRQIVYSNVYD